ncbi:hypothetical protein OsJ_11072 [Oryza sativa Japonica Group]|uniref:Uncharacterized protein n=1 Tax=Oryza sativa subsp. japonica TaxID=39947 RepID=B9F8Q9_ORYSJ|nr:hypothetical protein OsJ_11072 [Oryza sativa Japonica Group]
MARSSAAAALSDPGSGGEDDEEGRLSRCWHPPPPFSLPLSRRGSGPPAAPAVVGKAPTEEAGKGARGGEHVRLKPSPLVAGWWPMAAAAHGDRIRSSPSRIHCHCRRCLLSL